MRLKFVTAVGAAMLLAACSTSPDQSASVAGDGTFGAQNGMGQGIGQGQGQVSVGNIPAGSEEDFVVNVGDRIFFDYDRHDVNQQGQETLRRQAEWLQRYPNIGIVIEGHTDERGTREYNLGLGDRRANSVRTFLISQGVSGNRIRTVSFGKERPAILGNNDDAWARNRRGVTVVN